MRHCLTAILLFAGIAVAHAAASIPSSELPGRERYRFQELPIDRFTQPGTSTAKPAWRWECKRPKKRKHQRSASRRC